MISVEQKRIVRVLGAILRHTSTNEIKGKVISELTGADPRVVAEYCSWFYTEGWPVGSSGNGYFQTVGEDERRAQYHREIGRGTSIIRKTVRGRKAQADLGQVTLFEEDAA